MIFQNLSQTEKKLLLLFLSLLLCWWLFSASATCSASGTPEPVYQITETELVTLENNLARLSAINTKLQLESSTQREQVSQLQKQVALLQSQLSTLRQESQKQEDLLASANKSLAEYAIEAKKTRLRVKAQRNFWECFAAAAVIVAIAK